GIQVRKWYTHDVVRSERRSREARVQTRGRQRVHRPADSLRTMDRRTVALGIAAALAVAAALVVTLTNHSSVSPKHKAVAAYIQAVDQVQLQMHTQLTRTVRAYADFQRGKLPAKTIVPELAQAEATLSRLGHRIAALTAPPEAKHLRVLLGELTAAEVGIAHEVGQLARF